MIHRFQQDISRIAPPERFTYPFHYAPHPLTVIAAREVERYLSARTEWHEELQQGKMFGVLIVRTPEGDIAYLAAFSGNLAGSNRHDFFVPPVFDLLQPGGFFRTEERRISDINRRIRELENADELTACRQEAARQQEAAAQAIAQARAELKAAKARRDARRQEGGLSAAELQALTAESQYQKAEYKRLEKRLKAEVAEAETRLHEQEAGLQALKQERKSRSNALQLRLFGQFRLLNARGEQRSLPELFADTPQRIPPAGAGECALPKLLQYAYTHGLHPLAFGEFWWGDPPRHEVRRQGAFYPACQSKCAPILRHMLAGLAVDDNPLATAAAQNYPLETVYEDEWIVIVNKPAGLLSVPGKGPADSVLDRLRKAYPAATGPLLVHRLDMDTSGLLLAAKTKEVHAALQKMFETRQVKKRYTALLEGNLETEEGTICLPLGPDLTDRPRQQVDFEHGKPALTYYRVRQRRDGYTLVDLYPMTGRTHQLRVHAAHQEGLHHPIVGDPLYGKKAARLYLHAASLELVHPVSGKTLHVCREAAFTDE